MGMWSFVKDAGKKLLGVGAAEAAEPPAQDALQKEIKDLGLDASGLDITVEGDQVKVSGKAISQEMKEKVILAVGNVKGVAEVHDDVPGAEPVFHTVKKGDTLSAPMYGPTVTASQVLFSKNACAYMRLVLPISPRLASAMMK